MTIIKKFEAATYATLKHIQGYQLLRNPKGTNPYEVNMIKYRKCLTPDSDEVFFYKRINKSFDRMIPKSNNKTMMSTHIFDTEKSEMSRNKNIVIYGSGVDGYLREREDFSENILNARKNLGVNKKQKLFNQFDHIENDSQYFVPKSNWDIIYEILTLGHTHKQKNLIHPNKPKTKSFLKTLRENLSQIKEEN